jgi:hypothetical protein
LYRVDLSDRTDLAKHCSSLEVLDPDHINLSKGIMLLQRLVPIFWSAIAWSSIVCCSTVNASSTTLFPTADEITAIQQTLNLFSIAIDTKQYHLLNSVFTSDATFTDFSTGRDNIISKLETSLKDITSQHALSNLHVNMTGPGQATTINYLQGAFFGQGDLAGQIYENFGYYQDQLRLQWGGTWLIHNKTLTNFVSCP